mmetsp:Transcript_65531/g.156710  ORF Transcript_65531/g.156710 Transcript_65531/m.156710 type:complete len:290 (-) Transcript_65531:3158-4027(-)
MLCGRGGSRTARVRVWWSFKGEARVDSSPDAPLGPRLNSAASCFQFLYLASELQTFLACCSICGQILFKGVASIHSGADASLGPIDSAARCINFFHRATELQLFVIRRRTCIRRILLVHIACANPATHISCSISRLASCLQDLNIVTKGWLRRRSRWTCRSLLKHKPCVDSGANGSGWSTARAASSIHLLNTVSDCHPLWFGALLENETCADAFPDGPCLSSSSLASRVNNLIAIGCEFEASLVHRIIRGHFLIKGKTCVHTRTDASLCGTLHSSTCSVELLWSCGCKL